MIGAGADGRLEGILGSLIELPLHCTNSDDALKRLIQLCCEALRSRACTLVWVDLEQQLLTQVACSGFDEEFEAFMAQHKIKIGALHEGVSIDYELVAKGDVIKKYNLPQDGGGIARPEVAQRYGLQSALCQPLKIEDRVIGYLNHFSSSNQLFTVDEENLLKLFSKQAENIIKQFNGELLLGITSSLVSDVIRLSPNDFLKQLANRTCELISDSACLVWKLISEQGKLQVIAASEGVDKEYQRIELDYDERKALLASRSAKYLPDVTKSKRYSHGGEAKTRGWVSLLSVPMWLDDRLIGLFDVYTKYQHYFTESEKQSLEEFANLAALSIQKDTSTRRQRLEAINRGMASMAEERSIDKILRILLENSLEAAGIKWGWIRLLNSSTGELEVKAKIGTSDTPRPLKFKEGINWKAIIERRPQIADDVQSDEWKDWYVEFSEDTRSELAVPLVIDKVGARERTKMKLRSRAIGVLNLESPEVGFFSQTDVTYLLPLVRQAALLIDKLEAEEKLNGLREVERRIVGKRNWREVLETVVKEIKETLGFEYVNVSLVDLEQNSIKTEYVVGLRDDQIDEFKRMAVHSLDSNDIQATIVKTKKIEVPDQNDERFDAEIYKRFHHENLIRVFVPMVAPSNGEVIGTVEAGYNRRYRDFIYERDVRFLQSFVAYAVEAIEPSRLALLETISHELRSSIVGIRSNADYLRLLGSDVSHETTNNKLTDILTDSEILLLNVGELEYYLGRTSQTPRIEETFVLRDIVFKTVHQLSPIVRERKFDPWRIRYYREDARRIRIYVDKAKLNQVVFNLLLNSIKYAEDDPDQFSIKINTIEHNDKYILNFADWGMGIKQGLEEQIFNSGFRTPEARAKNVSGSGLGLTIARGRMREIGGDLIVVRNYKPTVFHMVIPKKLMEAPE